MKCNSSVKLTGINTWFIIEILSFYGYILSAIAFIAENSLKSSFGLMDKTHLKERYKSDFVAYHRLDLDWLAFVTILFNVNIGLICIDEYIIFTKTATDADGNTYKVDADGNELKFALKPIVIQLLVNHLFQMIFLRNFYDSERRVNTKNRWVWVGHLFSYLYIIYVYYFTDAVENDNSESSKIWIPLDIILTFNIALYQLFYNMMQQMEDEEKEDQIEQVAPTSINDIGENKETPLLDGESPQKKKAFGRKKSSLAAFKKAKKIELDSIYSVKEPKVTSFKLTGDSTSMGFGVFLKKDFLGLNLSAEQ